MAQEFLDEAQMHSRLDQMGGETVSQGVDSYVLADSAVAKCRLQCALNSALVHCAACVPDVLHASEHVGEQQTRIPVRDPACTEQLQCLQRKRDKAVLATFSSPYVHLHPPAVHVPDFEMDALVQTQTHAVDCEEADTVPQFLHRVHQQGCLTDCQDIGHCLELRGLYYFNPVPFPLQEQCFP